MGRRSAASRRSVTRSLTTRPRPLRWFPASIQVTEVSDASGFPMPDGYAIASPDSHLLDLAGLLGAYASVYSLTDGANADVGGSQPALAYFDGDPFPAQNQTPDGEPTLHDRALAMIRVIVVDMDRLHVDPATGLFADAATGTSPSRGTVAFERCRGLCAPLAAHRSTSARLGAWPLHQHDAGHGGHSFAPRRLSPDRRACRSASASTSSSTISPSVFYDKLTTSDGHAFAGWDGARSAPTDDGTSLDAHTAAIRGLLVAYLATGAVKFRDRAGSVFGRLETAFYDPAARVYRAAAGDRSPQVTFTPRRFGLLQAALRDTYELIAVLPGNGSMGDLIEDRVGRLEQARLERMGRPRRGRRHRMAERVRSPAAQGRTASRSVWAGCRWPSARSPERAARSSTSSMPRRASSRPIASTTAYPESRRSDCRPRSPTRSLSRSRPMGPRWNSAPPPCDDVSSSQP